MLSLRLHWRKPAEEERLRATAAKYGQNLTALARDELSELARTGLPVRVRARLYGLDLHLRHLEESRARLEKRMDTSRALIRRHEAHAATRPVAALLREALLPFEEEHAATLTKISEIRQEVDTIRRHHDPHATPMPAALPLLVAIPAGLQENLSTVIFATLAALVGLWWLARRYNGLKGALHWIGHQAAPGVVDAPARAGAPTALAADGQALPPGVDPVMGPKGNPFPTRAGGGVDLDAILRDFRTRPQYLEDHLHAFAGQTDGLERLRQFCEDHTFEARDTEADDGKVRVLLLPVTEGQLDLLDDDVRANFLSRRSATRGFVAQPRMPHPRHQDEEEDEAEEAPRRVEVAEGSNGNGTHGRRKGASA